MTREEEIQRKAGDLADFGISHCQSNQQQYYEGFIDGAKWADQHPREGLWDAKKVTEWLENYVRDFKYYIDVKGLVETLTKAMEK